MRPLAPVLAVAALLAALGAAELAARLFAPPGAPVRLEPFIAAVEQGHGVAFESVFASDPELFWRLASGVTLPEDARPFSGLVSNADGLREDHPIPLAKPPGEVRILFLGDSVTFGYLVRSDQCFVELVERELAERFPAARVECINAGVPGYSLFQGLRFLEGRGLSWDPDLVVLEFGWNDRARWEGGGDLERHAAQERARAPALLAWSRLAAIVARRLAPAPAGEARARLTPEEFHDLLEEAREVVRGRGVDLLLLICAGRFNLNPGVPEMGRTEYQIQQYRVGRETPFGPDGGPALVDCVAALRELVSEHSLDELFFDGIHPTPLGHRKMAEALVARLEPWLAARLRDPGVGSRDGPEGR